MPLNMKWIKLSTALSLIIGVIVIIDPFDINFSKWIITLSYAYMGIMLFIIYPRKRSV